MADNASMTTFEKLVIGLVVIGVIIFVGLRIMSEILVSEQERVRDLPGTPQTPTCNTTSGAFSGCTNDAISASNEVVGAIADVPAWLVILVVVVIGGFFIVYLRKGLAAKNNY